MTQKLWLQVTRWFAERADLVLLLFDEHKLDISDEFKSVIEGLKGLDSKLRCAASIANTTCFSVIIWLSGY